MTEPSSIIQRLKEHTRKVLLRIGILLESLNAVLELEEHVQSDYHYLLQIRISNLRIKEVLCRESAKRLLEGITLQTADVDSVCIIDRFKVLVLPRSHEGSERLIRNVDVKCGYCVHEFLCVLAL